MKKLHVCFWASLAALLMLAAVSADAADVKELFAIDLADYPSTSRRYAGERMMLGTVCPVPSAIHLSKVCCGSIAEGRTQCRRGPLPVLLSHRAACARMRTHARYR